MAVALSLACSFLPIGWRCFLAVATFHKNVYWVRNNRTGMYEHRAAASYRKTLLFL